MESAKDSKIEDPFLPPKTFKEFLREIQRIDFQPEKKQ